jgi:hypothetical protein
LMVPQLVQDSIYLQLPLIRGLRLIALDSRTTLSELVARELLDFAANPRKLQVKRYRRKAATTVYLPVGLFDQIKYIAEREGYGLHDMINELLYMKYGGVIR